MANKFFSSRKNVITLSVAISVALVLIATVITLLFVNTPKKEYVSASHNGYSVYYDKSGIDKNLKILSYDGYGEDFSITVPSTMAIDGKTYTVAEIGEKAFSGEKNTNLTEIEEIILPDTIESIGDYAFEKTTNILSLQIKGTVESYGRQIFLNSGIKSLTIDNLTHGMNVLAFDGMTLEKLIINNIVGDVDNFNSQFSANIKSEALYLGENVKNAKMFQYLGENVKTLSYFKGTELFGFTSAKLETIFVNGVGARADEQLFSEFSATAKAKVKNIYLDESCSALKQNAFTGFSALESVYMANRNINVDLDAFVGANDAAKIYTDENVTAITLTITAQGTSKTINSAFIAKIGDVAKVETISILNGVETISANTFVSATALKNINFMSNTTVSNIGINAFGTMQINFAGPIDETSYVYTTLHTSFADNIKTYNGK